ncbi:ABC transporter substrate-binding protein [Pyramidobacter sp. YE332]|uniref:ABC transporter substrate-binding protein n=1 Tax=unclassified Pyramidobacter TaxID=2632171 RepID=UPI00098F7F26|nr:MULTISPECIES: ABC transporter substrate-binding protein [unclassified Pyramidobacter]OON89508.1 ABC transporter substrate-binding protein [Pyramidobacter sp. C12-8]WOL40299.1 ABC transporter substrate-binding protein [Pyramidobacter sp. YE332]
MKRTNFLSFLLIGALFFAAPGWGKSGETVTFVDDTGAEATVPKNPERVVISSIMPLTSIYCLYRGGAQGLVGIPAAAMSAAEHSYLAKMYPDILKLKCDFATGGKINVEEIIKMAPDVVFYRASEKAEGEMYRRAGIPAVGFKPGKYGGDPVGTFADWADYLGKIFGSGDKTDGVADFGRETLKMIQERTANTAEKPRALMFAGFSGGQLVVAGSGDYASFYLKHAGGVNAAAELKGWKTVNLEQIYSWDPEVIFINNFCPYVPEDFYDNAIEGYDWSNVAAVKNRRVHKFPLGVYRWYPPSGDTPLSLVWVAQRVHPELFGDVDLDAMMKDYYRRFYGYELTGEDLKAIYNPPREAAIF